jgi:hypothetical protein
MTVLNSLTYFVAVTGIAECIAQALADHEVDGTLGRPGRVGVTPGAEVPWDGCECGQLALAFQHGPYPSNIFPTEISEDTRPLGCFTGSSAVRVIASLIRCQYHPAMATDGTPPSIEVQTAAARLQQIEQFYMRNAIICCLHDMLESNLLDDSRIGASDYQVNGDCGQVSIIFWIGVV